MASTSKSGFSQDLRLFASGDADGKLRVWETQQNVLLQEYTPNLHLTSPCSCLKWLCASRRPESHVDTGAPQKKKRKSRDVGEDIIAIGTSNGRILLYSVASAAVEGELVGGHKSASITGLSWFPGTSLYSCGGDSIAEWDIVKGKVKSKWKAGTDQIACVLVCPDGSRVLSASRSIKLWDATKHVLLRTFTGHATLVLSLTFVPKPASNGDYYFLSTAKGDRYINVWSLGKDGESAVVAMVLESAPVGPISLHEQQDNGVLSLAAVTESGVVQMFSHQLNGRCPKPLKPTLTVQVATDSARSKESVEPLSIVSALCTLKQELKIAYGSAAFLSFENVVLNYDEKIQVLVRQSPRKPRPDSTESSLVQVPDAENAQFLPQSAANAAVLGIKRSHTRTAEVPMEQRLENLSLSLARSDEKPTAVPRADNLAQLMLQALQSKDKQMLHTVLRQQEEDVIRNTVRRLPLQVIEPLLKELTTLLHGKTVTAQTGARWLRIVLSIHAAHLMANPSLVELLAPVIGLIEARLTLLPSLSRLSGRLELLTSQLNGASGSDENASPLDMPTGLLTYQDADTSDEDDVQDEVGGLGSESDDHWEELSDSNLEDNENENDVDMSD
ncbi:WD repeat-containing protein 43 [Thrips palmi]|uniref:WD repeat-containing protein 43 n=1 Tax=Thrips palmi TaxID=161013 RepID=A0A6P8Z3G5_THRPL|nr:WD repeat-containing protein 43 [Thrips palmi]